MNNIEKLWDRNSVAINEDDYDGADGIAEKVAGKSIMYKENFEAAMTEYASLNRQGWTRVEDGNLPAQGERVLVYCEGGLIEKGYRIGMLWERDWAGTTFHEAGYKVTHWMPLPNKPI